MIPGNLDSYSKTLQKIISLTKEQNLEASLVEVLKKYSESNEKSMNTLPYDVLESLQWIAERTGSAEAVRTAIKIFMLDSVKNIFSKYKGDIADEIIMSIEYCIED